MMQMPKLSEKTILKTLGAMGELSWQGAGPNRHLRVEVEDVDQHREAVQGLVALLSHAGPVALKEVRQINHQTWMNGRQMDSKKTTNGAFLLTLHPSNHQAIITALETLTERIHSN